eukprot:1158338-Pelagomonas_calceolata.AAC.2
MKVHVIGAVGGRRNPLLTEGRGGRLLVSGENWLFGEAAGLAEEVGGTGQLPAAAACAMPKLPCCLAPTCALAVLGLHLGGAAPPACATAPVSVVLATLV